jgi:hypothetical protein
MSTAKQGRVVMTAVMVVWLIGVSISMAATHYVDLNSPTPTPPYTTWATAAHGIQEAVNIATNGSTVLVADGRYVLSEQITIANAITVRSDNGAEHTIVDGDGVTRCFYVNNTPAVIDGFTITGGATNNGAGIYFNRDGRVENSVIVSNTATGSGGGIYLANGGLIQNCVVSENSAANGGGLYSSVGSRTTIVAQDSRFESNTATGSGGGVYQGNWGGTVSRCRIEGNASRDGGGAYLTYQSQILNSLIVGNTATRNGGGVSLNSTSDQIRNCTVVDNTAQYGGGLYDSGGRTAYNSIIYHNTAMELGPNWHGEPRLYNTCTTPTNAPTSVDNIEAPPLFVNRAGGDYRLRPGSPCIDNGDNSYASGDSDLAGQTRIMNGVVDMGAYEHDPAPLSAGIHVPGDTVFCEQPSELEAISTGTNIAGLVYYWDFDNDGTWDVIGGEYSSATHAFTQYGAHSVRLMVSNVVGETATHILPITVGPATAHVAPGGSSVYPYSSWATAATTIQDAVDAAVDGTLVLITNGTYGVSSRIVVEKGAHLRSVNGPGATFIQGDGSDRCMHMGHPSALIEGLTLTGGSNTQGGGVSVALGVVSNSVVAGNNATSGGGVLLGNGGFVKNSSIHGNNATSGGGAYCIYGGQLDGCVVSNNTASTGGGIYFSNGGTVRTSQISGNTATGSGGGIYLANGGLIQNCVVSENSAANGGGLYSSVGSRTTIVAQDSRFESNTATGSGGGVYQGNWGGTVSRCRIEGNASRDGGGAYLTYQSQILNSLIVGNTATRNGGGVSLNSTSDQIRNCTVVDNTAQYGGGLYDSGGRTAYNSIIYHNTAMELGPNWHGEPRLYNTCTTPTNAPTSVDNIEAPPLFVNRAGGDYRLQQTSPCIDSGNNSYVIGDTDLDGKPRILYDIVDMGAYEWPFMITAWAGSHGEITQPGILWIPYGSNRTYTIAAAPHHHITDVLVNGASIGLFGRGSNTFDYTFLNVTNNQTIEAFFRIDWHTVEVLSAHGDPNPPRGVHTNDYGTALLYSVSAEETYPGATQYVCLGWTMSDHAPGSGTVNTVGFSLTNDTALAWLWATNYWLSAQAADGGAHGQVTADTGWQPAGSRHEVAGEPVAYYHFSEWSGDTDLIEFGTPSSSVVTVRMDRAAALLGHFAANLAPLGTPEWWLAGHGLTEGGFAASELLDSDGDGMKNWEEFVADTNPTNAASVLRFRGLQPTETGMRIEWQGGVQARQVLERAVDLTHPDPWQPVLTNEPPTPVEDDHIDVPPGQGPHFYRITVERP